MGRTDAESGRSVVSGMKKVRRLAKTGICLFCQRRFPVARLTKEHVFAEWLINRAQLQTAKIVFPNGTSTRYSNITVPACHKCNTQFGSRFENQIKGILDDFPTHKRELITNLVQIDNIYTGDDSARTKLVIWLQKLFFGLLYFEAHLINVPPDTIRWARTALRSAITFRHTCRSICTGRGYNLPATLLVFELGGNSSPGFDFMDCFDPMCVGLKIDRKLFFVAIADGQLVNTYLHGRGLARLRKDVMTGRFGTVSHLMAFAYATATRRCLPTSPKFAYSEDQITNMSNMGLGPPPLINTRLVIQEANGIYRDLCAKRNVRML